MMEVSTEGGIVVASDRRWALIADEVVVAVILWDGNKTTFDPTPKTAVELGPDERVGDGWRYVDGLFIAPVADPE